MKKKTTINDIARKLNTTPATVSRALNDQPDISEEMKKKVRKVATQMDYHINKIASSLRLGKTQIIGVLLPSAGNLFFGSLIHGITNIATEFGYDVLIYQSNESHDYEVKGINAFIHAHVDGIIASLARDTKNYDHFLKAKKKHIPIVFCDRAKEDLDIPSVVIDDLKGGYLATDHLIKQGYKRVAHITGPLHIKAFADRYKGYKDALKANRIKFDRSLVFQGDISLEAGRDGVQTLLNISEPPDAIFAVEDFTALGALKELKNHKVKVGKNFGVFGFCNDLSGEHITPSLSSIDQQTIRMGQEAFTLLYNILKKKAPSNNNTKIILDPIPVIRKSSMR